MPPRDSILMVPPAFEFPDTLILFIVLVVLNKTESEINKADP